MFRPPVAEPFALVERARGGIENELAVVARPVPVRLIRVRRRGVHQRLDFDELARRGVFERQTRGGHENVSTVATGYDPLTLSRVTEFHTLTPGSRLDWFPG